MPFVKLDCGILDSTLWPDRQARELFVTALLMAKPHRIEGAEPIIHVRSTDKTGEVVPDGWYGFVPASGAGIIRRAGLQGDEGMDALDRLCGPDPESRTPDFNGRRMARVDGGYLILNFAKYRDKDHTAAERAKRYRENKALRDGPIASRVTSRNDTHAESREQKQKAEAETRKAKAESVETVFPHELDTETFREKWKEFMTFRSKLKKPLLPESVNAQLKTLARYGEAIATQSIEASIGNGWQGLFPEKIKPQQIGAAPKPTPLRPPQKLTYEE